MKTRTLRNIRRAIGIRPRTRNLKRIIDTGFIHFDYQRLPSPILVEHGIGAVKPHSSRANLRCLPIIVNLAINISETFFNSSTIYLTLHELWDVDNDGETDDREDVAHQIPGIAPVTFTVLHRAMLVQDMNQKAQQ